MGAKLARRLYNKTGRADIGTGSGNKLSKEQMKEIFNNYVCKTFKKQVASNGQNRLVVGGRADKYPYWISVMDLRQEAGDENKLSSTSYMMLKEEKTITKAKPKIPLYLHKYINQTLRLALRYNSASPELNKSKSFSKIPEFRVLKKSVRRLFLRLSVDISHTNRNDDGMDITLYEQHVRNRKVPHLRPMRVTKVIYDSDDNFAFMGEEFLLTIYKSMEDLEDISAVGTYYRSLDTSSQTVLAYDYKQQGYITDHRTVSESSLEEYKKILLSKHLSTKNSKFNIALPGSQQLLKLR